MSKYELSDEEISEILDLIGARKYELKKDMSIYELIGGGFIAVGNYVKKEIKVMQELEDKLNFQ